MKKKWKKSASRREKRRCRFERSGERGNSDQDILNERNIFKKKSNGKNEISYQ